MSFNALLLAAGFGTRLRPITNNTPKCLVKIGGKPILEIWLDNLHKAGCKSVLVNTHYLANQVEDFLMNISFKDMSIVTSYESEILGTAGTLIKNREFFDQKYGLMIHADNFTNTNIKEFVNFHSLNSNKKNKLLTMMTFRTDNPESCGIVETNKEGFIKNFYEKESNFHGFIANAAVYCFDKKLLNYLTKNNETYNDFSNEVIPKILNKIQTYHTNSIFIDIGTIDNLKRANKLIDLI